MVSFYKEDSSPIWAAVFVNANLVFPAPISWVMMLNI